MRLPSPSSARAGGLLLFIALACGLTWCLDAPLSLAWWQRRAPAPYALGLAGLGAFGPALAALIVAAPRRELGAVFGRWRAPPLWILAALLVVPAVHLVATLVEVALGGAPAQWFYPPVRPEHVAALVAFSFGEELGWRGFAYPRLERALGPVKGSLLLGLIWAAWHLTMMISPDDGRFMLLSYATFFVDLPVYSVIFAWLFERTDRSLAVAVALHMGAHLDNISRAPEGELRLRLLRTLVAVALAALAARDLQRRAALAR